MKNLLKICLIFTAVVVGFYSCSTDDKVVDDVLDGATNGAVLRALNDTSMNDAITLGAGNTYTIQLEEQDVQDGGLLDVMNVYVRFDDKTVLSANSITGAGADLSFPAITDPDALLIPDVLLRSYSAAEFSTDTPFGLPRVDVDITEADLATVLPTSDFNTGDTVRVRLELVLTDGRVFSLDDAGGIITGFGSFFSSPFQHIIQIDSGIDINYLDESRNSFVVIDGFNNDYFVQAEITDQSSGANINSVNVYRRFIDNTPDNGDNTQAETLNSSYTTADFGTSPDGFPTIDVTITEAEMLGTLTEADISIGDAFYVRYEVITEDGRTVSNELTGTNFYDEVVVTDCPFPALDETDSFTGDYLAEQLVQTIFGYDTFDPDGGGVILTLYSGVTDASQEEPGIELNDNQRAFDAEYIAALGFGNPDTYIMEFNICEVTISDGAGPVDGSTGVTCTQANIILLGPTPGGSYNAEDDTEFVLIFDEDLLQDCGQGPNMPQIRFTKQ